MMFKGTDQLGPNEFSRVIAANGGRENAFTGRDYTAYFQRLEKSRLPISFELESDRMHNLKLDIDEFKKEVEVVKEERRLRTDDRPQSLVYEKFMATAFRTSKYRNPIIGWPQDLDSMRLQDLEHWYQRFYAPNNATVVVAGDVDPDAVFELAEKYFGKVPRRDLEPIDEIPELQQDEPRRIQVKLPAKVPYLLIGFHVPSINATKPDDWEPYALDILAYILDGGKSARLPARLVREQRIASSVGAGYDPVSRLPTLFVIDGNPANGKTTEELETALQTELERLKSELVSQPELRKVKAQIVASNVFGRDSVFYQAMKLGELETVGLDWRLESQMVDRLRAVTAEQVRAVARKYLKPTNMTVAVLAPQPLDNQGG
jgi:zinc protease